MGHEQGKIRCRRICAAEDLDVFGIRYTLGGRKKHEMTVQKAICESALLITALRFCEDWKRSRPVKEAQSEKTGQDRLNNIVLL